MIESSLVVLIQMHAHLLFQGIVIHLDSWKGQLIIFAILIFVFWQTWLPIFQNLAGGSLRILVDSLCQAVIISWFQIYDLLSIFVLVYQLHWWISDFLYFSDSVGLLFHFGACNIHLSVFTNFLSNKNTLMSSTLSLQNVAHVFNFVRDSLPIPEDFWNHIIALRIWLILSLLIAILNCRLVFCWPQVALCEF